MHGLLCFLLFAGALHVDLGGLLDHRWTIAALSTVGVVLSVAVVGKLTWLVLDILGLHQRLLVCLFSAHCFHRPIRWQSWGC